MKTLSTILLPLIVVLGGCSHAQLSETQQPGLKAFEQKPAAEALQAQKTENYSYDQTEKALSIEAALDRKIIRDANLTIEVASTTEAQQRVTSIAETLGGFVVTSEAKQREDVEPAKRTLDIKLVIRVPSAQFNSKARKQLAGAKRDRAGRHGGIHRS